MSIPLNKEVFEEYMEACLISPTPRVCMAPGTVALLGLMESFKSWCDAKKKPIYGRLTLVEFSRIVRACGFEVFRYRGRHKPLNVSLFSAEDSLRLYNNDGEYVKVQQ